MAIREIITVENENLHKQCKPVKQVDAYILRLLDDMMETMHHANGVGLAAPQVGVLRRVCVVDVDGEQFELITPEIIEASGEQEDLEGCLSAPGRFAMVKRPNKVTVRATNRNGETVEYTGEGLLARAFCHEIDHLKGQVFLDIMEYEVEPEED